MALWTTSASGCATTLTANRKNKSHNAIAYRRVGTVPLATDIGKAILARPTSSSTTKSETNRVGATLERGSHFAMSRAIRPL